MSLLLSNDTFNLDTDCTVHASDSDNSAASHVSDSRDCEETNEKLEVNEELGVVDDSNGQSQCEGHRDVDGEEEQSADSIGDVVRNGDKSANSWTNREPNTGDESDELSIHRQHGVHSFRYALHIDIASHITVERTEDNADVVRTLQELTTLLRNRYTPAVKRWLEVNIHHF